MKLTGRLAITLFAVAAVAVGVASILINRAALSDFDRFMSSVVAADADAELEWLGRTYLSEGRWILPAAGHGGRIIVVDNDGSVVADSAGIGGGREPNMPSSWPAKAIVVDGQTLGTAYFPGGHMDGFGGGGPPHMATMAGDFRARANRALLVGLAAALTAALMLALAGARYLVKPIVSLRAATAAIASGQFSHRSGIKRDDEIGELAADFDRMAEALENQESGRRQLFADLAHELRTPLTVLRGNLQAMADGVYEPTPERINSIVARVDALSRLISDIRDLSLVEVGRLQLELDEVDVADVARAARDRFAALAAAKNIDLKVQLGAEPGAFRLDRNRIDQALDNLLGNALQHTPSGGTVTVGAGTAKSADGDRLLTISVRDTGPGIPAADLERVFERFYRGDPSRSRDTGGTGLGLAIVRAVARAHGGDARAENHPDGGASLRIWLPEGRTPDGQQAIRGP